MLAMSGHCIGFCVCSLDKQEFASLVGKLKFKCQDSGSVFQIPRLNQIYTKPIN